MTFLRNVALGHAVLSVILVVAALVNSTEILGVGRWVKPLKFAISIAVFTGTMSWLLSYFPRPQPRVIAVLALVIGVMMTGEMLLIAAQSSRGVRSHFNHDTAFDDAIFSAMGAMILINTVAVAYVGWLFVTRRTSITGAHLLGVQLGIAVFLLASVEGGVMVSLDAHTVGAADGGPGLPFVNWSTSAGDLRVAHFVGMHALQALPVLGWLLDRSKVRHARRTVAAAAVAWAALTALLLGQAVSGQPLLPG